MEVTEDRTREVRYYQRTVEFTGRPAEDYVGYVNKGKQWIPSRAYAKYNHGEPITDIKVSGPLAKKDGTPSVVEVDVRYITPAHRGWGHPFDHRAPEWLLELFNIEPTN
jgi:hypothetical protein